MACQSWGWDSAQLKQVELEFPNHGSWLLAEEQLESTASLGSLRKEDGLVC